ncbi:tetratricopeptide repeat protein [Aliarcobacter butzleri]|uniref:beta-lactamase n=1 Tax=Aliarcobacter butzleri TaxID=28197 RepID=A0AAW7Q699_9BACT|nr:hypothetical protein [Aliarcobacter butzleri]MDN5114970.1 hypothetical protein [Aliarcobacter butzleri]
MRKVLLLVLCIDIMFAGVAFDEAISKHQKGKYTEALSQYIDICKGAIKEEKISRGVACQMAGEMSENGIGTFKNHKNAFNFYVEACQFNIKSCALLGRAYYTGIGVEKDNTSGHYYMKLACEGGLENDICRNY